MRHGRTCSRCGSFGAFPILRSFRNEAAPSGFARERGPRRLVLCQVTSKPYGDARAIPIDADGFASGSLRLAGYARPGKLFTANQSLIAGPAGMLKAELCNQIIESVVLLLRGG